MPKVSDSYKEKRRHEILKNAEKVFINKGFGGTTMTDIVNATGLSRGGLYHYFSNTDEIYQALLHINDEEFNEYFDKLEGDYSSIWEAVEAFLKDEEQSLKNPENSLSPVNLEYFVIGRHEAGRAQYMSNRYERWVSKFVNLFEIGVRNGEFSPVQSLPSIAMFLINSTDAMHVQLLLLSDEKADLKGQIQALRLYLQTALGVVR
ncbi:TetR family transcriptional regulator [Ferdinandcohnia quinoae]|uniref:TetR family transcriptional regulator n=1 Tax=Fredinandcohnia quinoae TaxID=2918902 RepID=A0AAW5E6T2_9BACI|nr:TetR family transcriptional regulator [Fredinandcohnia sp. SECRCQ15]MCH1625597.1 TetR family transcriptional regulator [Fredinandcohnia sp. SECRCQ15]